jgi:hypothetical protein
MHYEWKTSESPGKTKNPQTGICGFFVLAEKINYWVLLSKMSEQIAGKHMLIFLFFCLTDAVAEPHGHDAIIIRPF